MTTAPVEQANLPPFTNRDPLTAPGGPATRETHTALLRIHDRAQLCVSEDSSLLGHSLAA